MRGYRLSVCLLLYWLVYYSLSLFLSVWFLFLSEFLISSHLILTDFWQIALLFGFYPRRWFLLLFAIDNRFQKIPQKPFYNFSNLTNSLLDSCEFLTIYKTFILTMNIQNNYNSNFLVLTVCVVVVVVVVVVLLLFWLLLLLVLLLFLFDLVRPRRVSLITGWPSTP